MSNYNVKSMKAEEFISDAEIRETLEYAEANKIPYVDYYTPMASGPERSLNPDYSKDGVHPTLEGYLVMEALIQPAIDKAL